MYLQTKDNVKISINYYGKEHDSVIIICPGWFMTKDSRLFTWLAECFAAQYDVILMDFRGHGKSGGFYTFTSKEIFDIDIVVGFAKKKYEKIFLLGFSLGAGLSLIYASESSVISGVIAVSPYTDFYKIENQIWHPNAWGPTLFKKFEPKRWLSVRPGYPFYKKIKPIDIVDRITVPLLFVAGKMDKTVYPWHTEKLFSKAIPPKNFELFEKGIHAEDIFMDNEEKFLNLCYTWLKDL